jgi:hypothetical protein
MRSRSIRKEDLEHKALAETGNIILDGWASAPARANSPGRFRIPPFARRRDVGPSGASPAMNSRRLIQSMTLETIAPLSDDPAWNNAGGTRAVRAVPLDKDSSIPFLIRGRAVTATSISRRGIPCTEI